MQFKKYLESEAENIYCYCDMDGVIAAWEDHFEAKMGYAYDTISRSQSFKVTKNFPVEWWATIPWLDEGPALWKYLCHNTKKGNLYILSSPTNDVEEKSIKGKWIWLEKHGIVDTIGRDHIILDSEKHKYVKENGISILVDDTPKKIDKWVNAGGIGILHINNNETFKKLKENGV
jgi:hypothetical protein